MGLFYKIIKTTITGKPKTVTRVGGNKKINIMKKIFLAAIIMMVAFSTQAQKAAKPNKIIVQPQFGYSYIASSQKENADASKTLFAGNGHSIQVGATFFQANYTTKAKPRLGGWVKTAYQFGNTNKSGLDALGWELVKTPFTYKTTQSTTNWQQVVLMGGPVVDIPSAKKYLGSFAFSATAGAAFKLNPRTITIDKYDAQTKLGTVYTQTDKSTSFVWDVNMFVGLARISKKAGLGLQIGYGSQGGTVGIVAGGPPKIKLICPTAPDCPFD